MKIIDLLNKIANGEEVPKHIHIRDVDYYTWQEDVKAYWSDRDENNLLADLDLSSTNLKEDIEILEEEKRIPEKLPIGLKQTKDGIFNTIVKDDIQYELNEKEEIICKKIHEIIDYLKSKEE